MSNLKKIEDYIKAGYNTNQRFGLELEHFIYDNNYNVISADEMTKALLEIVENMSVESDNIYMENELVSMIDVNGHYNLSVEPGCQLEISLKACEDIEEIRSIYHAFREVAEPVFASQGYGIYQVGVFPPVESGDMDVAEITLLNKERYKIMDKYFQNTGEHGRYMMRATAATQVSIDFTDEKDAVKKLRVLQKIAPIVAMLTENRTGRKKSERWNEYLVRNQIWRSVDDDRCGYVKGSLGEEYSISDWAKYIYENKGLLTYKNGELTDITGQDIPDVYKDHDIEDVPYLLSMYFPTVRLKNYIEYRIADSMDIDDAVKYIYFIKAIVYNPKVLDGLDNMFAHITEVAQVEAAEDVLFTQGYDATIYGRAILEWIEEIFNLIYENTTEDLEHITGILPVCLLNKIYVNSTKGNDTQCVQDNETIKAYLMQSTAKYKDRVVRTLQVPKIFSQTDAKLMKETVEELYGIFDAVIAQYMSNLDYRKYFDFDERLEKLILAPKTYKCNIPMSRIDIFLNEKTKGFKFCEFNTDGASAMNEDKELNKAFALTEAYQNFYEKFNCMTYELFDSWVEESLNVYADYIGNAEDVPNVCIVDFLENATINEFYIFEEAYKRKGCKVSVCDIRELEFKDGICYSPDGMKVDMVYRRAVTSDIMKHYDEVPTFLEAFHANAFCLVGDFRTQIAHNKVLYMVLHKEETHKFLTKKQVAFVKNHIPYTIQLSELKDKPEVMDDVLKNKDSWIIKPEDSYGSKGVYAGVEIDTQDEWAKIISDNMDDKYILQEFHNPYRTDNVKVDDEKCDWIDTSNLTGIFVYNGKFKGLYSRMSFEKMISTQYNEMSSPTVVAK